MLDDDDYPFEQEENTMAGSQLTLCFNSKKECEILKSQIATSSSNWRNRLVFTEHDALQIANVLNSEQANRMIFLNETLPPDPTVKDFLIVREKAKVNRDNPIKVACRKFRQTTIPLYLVQGCAINNSLQVLSSSLESTIRDLRIVQNKQTLKLCAGVDFYSIGSAIRESLIPDSVVNKHFGYLGRVCSVIRKFRNTDFSLNQLSYYGDRMHWRHNG